VKAEVGIFTYYLNGFQLTLTGIYAPGYEERRRQRLMDKYGVDVKARMEAS
jgi:hypothetical protein